MTPGAANSYSLLARSFFRTIQPASTCRKNQPLYERRIEDRPIPYRER